MRILIAGGGASGMTAAIAAARQGASVTILEKKEMPGKKILSTGNGRCNLTNTDMRAVYFRGGERETVDKILSKFGPEDTLRFFAGMGLMTKTRGTLVYPVNDQAAAVREALAMELKRLDVQVCTGVTAERIQRSKGCFHVFTSGAAGKHTYTGDALVLSAGGKAAPALGSDGSGYTLASSMGHTIVKPLPALVQLRSDESFLGKTSGVRADARIELYAGERPEASDTGEIQFTDYGISGIPVFQVSRFASDALSRGQNVKAVLDFMPGIPDRDFAVFLSGRKKIFSENTAEEFLHGLFHRKLAPVLLTRARIRWKEKMADVEDEALTRLAAVCKHFTINITGTNSFEHAQVCSGGVPLSEIEPDTMQSRIVEGLFIAGELLDADGMCGGYNLQWAWATGYLAGKAAGMQEDGANVKKKESRRQR